MATSAFDLMTLLDAPGVGPSRVRSLLRKWRSQTDIPLMDKGLLAGTLTTDQMEALPKCRERTRQHLEKLQKKNVQVLSILDDNYPKDLRNVLGDESPVLLLCTGNLGLLGLASVGFCGSRGASEKGIRTAQDSAGLLSREHINIVSGYAAGVDMSAHRAALRTGGTTTIVLAEGILRFRIKIAIKDEWDYDRVLVLSEYGPNLPWSVSHAMQRNRTICGLSRALVLIEARSSGGSIEAGRECLRLGLPLFAAVYEGSPDFATGNDELLRQGAKRLMKSRRTDLPNIRPILEAVQTRTGRSIPFLAASAKQ